ncbi:MAG: hypothetical protein IGR93_20695 [Hydrococcus sp. C42_A2020_068]|uniref:hypothetical protein n=1 Tax=Pleurocapsa sp. PCC 7327 TaxID=118163 RepID=UPI00029FFDA8|nr:hypothetical protein [Pleurocapsa sp. PCC 7327]AFY77009.1 hypothetical protein Ple7327_1643 [Pleurocapsa sp. PCC 7327]MBF2022442.1 hypothetical protein [Hydrococcus sp. C42_A2020_068]
MKLDQQLQILIEEASEQGVPAWAMEKAVIPILKAFASQLQHLEYYILQSRDRDWIVTTLSNVEKPQQEKRVIYAFSSPEDAANSQENSNLEIAIASVPVTHLLFQLFALDGVESLIFLETPGNLEKGVEIFRASLQNGIHEQLKSLSPSTPSKSQNIPSNLA